MGETAHLDDSVGIDRIFAGNDPRGCELVLDLLGRKWIIPILRELEIEPRRRRYFLRTLKVPNSRLDPTIQQMSRWGLITRTFIPNGRHDDPGLAITDLGRSFLSSVVVRLNEWQREHQVELLDNSASWQDQHEGQF